MLDVRRGEAVGGLRQWRLRLLLWRNRWLADPRVIGWATRNPLTRWKARRHSRALFDLMAGFVYSQVTVALVESGMLDLLATDARLPGDLARLTGLAEERTRTLLLAAASLGLTTKVGDHWTLGERGAALAGTPGLSLMIRHHRLFYADLADPLALLDGHGPTRLSRLWDYGDQSSSEDAATYSALMSATQPLVAAQALAAYPFRRHRRLLDIGGGHGTFLAEVGRACPKLKLGIVDRPEVLAAAGLPPDIARHPGSFLTDALPRGYDLHTLVRVLHDHDDAAAMTILRASRAALPEAGRLLVVEPMARLGRAPEGHAYFGLYLLAMRSGRPREASEISAMMREAGFENVRSLRTPLPLVANCVEAIV